jgi:uncharacterized membrane protein (UPF0136 family)
MISVARFSLLGFGIMVMLGGVLGWVKAKSKPSLIAGVISGVVLTAIAFITSMPSVYTYATGGVVTLILTMIFLSRLMKTKKLMPAGVMTAASIFELVILMLCYMMGAGQ